MKINKLPGVYYNETINYYDEGEIGKIPVFIAPASPKNLKASEDELELYSDYDEFKTVYGEDSGNEYTIRTVIKEFFEESELPGRRSSEYDIHNVPYIYFIPLESGTSQDEWLEAIVQAKQTNDIDIEVYFGLENLSTDIKELMEAVSKSLTKYASELELRVAFYTYYKQENTDTELINLSKTIQYPRVAGLVEPLNYGKTIARICVTPYYIEPGYLQYRTLNEKRVVSRSKDQELLLQSNGIIFNHVEKTTNQRFVKINLGISSEFSLEEQPADAVLQSRFIADHMLLRVFDLCYPQIKANESRTNLTRLQTNIDTLVQDMVQDGIVIPYNPDTGVGTNLRVVESDNDPWAMIIDGMIQPVNSSYCINVDSTLYTAVNQAVKD